MTIPLSDIEQFLVSGWTNSPDLDISRLIEDKTVTIIVSDGPFVVPTSLPGGVTLIASKQHEFTGRALIKMRVITRDVAG